MIESMPKQVLPGYNDPEIRSAALRMEAADSQARQKEAALQQEQNRQRESTNRYSRLWLQIMTSVKQMFG